MAAAKAATTTAAIQDPESGERPRRQVGRDVKRARRCQCAHVLIYLHVARPAAACSIVVVL